jgi:F0F1-type ATP synthase membrane subunit b/b'
MERRRDIKDLESYLEEAVKNIRDDRAITSALLADIVVLLKKNEQNHKEVGGVAAKYVETLQRSNEQLVKVASLLQKREDNLKQGLTERDREDIFDIIDNNDDSGGDADG